MSRLRVTPDFGRNPHFAVQVFSGGLGKAGQEFLQAVEIDRHSRAILASHAVESFEYFPGNGGVIAEIVKGHEVALKFGRKRIQFVKGHFECRLADARIDLRIDPDLTPFPRHQSHA